MFMSVYKNLMYSPFKVFLKNEVVDVQNEVAMDICLDLTCAWKHEIHVFLTNLVLSKD